jgi:hypothetical protein
MIDSGLPAGDLDLDWHIGTQELLPRKFAGELVELSEVTRMKCADAGQDARGAANFKIRPPNLWPTAPHQHATHNLLGVNEVQGPHLGAKHSFKAGRGHQKYLKITAYGHRARISQKPALIDNFPPQQLIDAP